MKNFSLVIHSLASLAWPILGFCILILLRKEVKDLFSRLAKAKILGQEIELREKLSELKESTDKAEETADLFPVPETNRQRSDYSDLEKLINNILQNALHSPKLALVELFSTLESHAQKALSTRGLLNGKKHVPLRLALDNLKEYGFPPNLLGSLSLFVDVRNKIVHGRDATDGDALSAIDSGITLLRVIDALPSEVNRVKEANVKIYSDNKCQNLIKDATGIILETTSPGGAMKIKSIYPTTLNTYVPGKIVGWDWNLSKIWGPAWYRETSTNKILQAWGSSGEFIGPHLDEL